jgi:hypothetical protein
VKEGKINIAVEVEVVILLLEELILRATIIEE